MPYYLHIYIRVFLQYGRNFLQHSMGFGTNPGRTNVEENTRGTPFPFRDQLASFILSCFGNAQVGDIECFLWGRYELSGAEMKIIPESGGFKGARKIKQFLMIQIDRKSTRLNSSPLFASRLPSSA